MEQYINPLWKERDRKINEFEQNIERGGVEYLKLLNAKARVFAKQKNLKTKDYVKMQKERLEEGNNGN